MAGGRRRMVTRSVSATHPQLLSSSTPAPPPPLLEEPQEELAQEPDQDQQQPTEQQSHDGLHFLAAPPAFKKRQSSINLDDLKEEEVGSSGHKRVKGEHSDTSADEQEERRLEGGGENAGQIDDQPGPSGSKEPSPPPTMSIGLREEEKEIMGERDQSPTESSGGSNALKRTRDAEMEIDEDEPRKRRAVSDEASDTPRQEQKHEQDQSRDQAAAPAPSSSSSVVKRLSLFNPKTPFLDLRSMSTPKLGVPKSRSLPKMPSQFTPVFSSIAKRVSSPGKQMKRLSLDDSGYCDLVVPLKGEDEHTPRARMGSPALPNAKFTFNPFAIGASNKDELEDEEKEGEEYGAKEKVKERHKSEPPEMTGGDKFGPAVPSLDQLLENSDESARLTDSVIRRGPQQEDNGGMSPPPSPTKQVLPPNINAANAKVRPSMIPRLVLAPPPPPTAKKPAAVPIFARPASPQKKPLNKALASISPSKSFLRFFASPAKGSTNAGPSAPPPRPATALGRSTTTSFLSRKAGTMGKAKAAAAEPGKDGDELRRSTTLSEEAQASLAKMSQALEKLAAPRPRNSAGSTSSSSEGTAVGSSSSSPDSKQKKKDAGEDRPMELDDLPPRPSTSLGFSPGANPLGAFKSLRTKADKGKEKEKTGKRFDGLFASTKTAGGTAGSKKTQDKLAAASKGKALASDDEDDEEEEPDQTVTTPPKGKGKGKDSSPNPSTEEVEVVSDCLQGCVIFVDVRTEEGSDASAMFVRMLRQLSAKVISRPGVTATHYVWKSGLQSTISRYTTLEEPKPFLVGIGWVMKCGEKKERVDEKNYLVNVKEAEVIFGHKRRRSMQVKDRSSLMHGLGVSTLHKPTVAAKARTVSNPAVTQSARPAVKKPAPASSNTITKYFAKGKGKVLAKPAPPLKAKLLQAPPTPVREEPEPPEDTEMPDVEPSTSKGKVKVDIPMDVDDEDTEPPPPQLLREKTPPPPPPEAITKPSVPTAAVVARPPPAALPKPPPNLFAKPKAPPSKPAPGPLDGLEELLADTKTTLLEEAQKRNLRADQLERARKKTLLFAPKVSSPLKRHVSSFDERGED